MTTGSTGAWLKGNGLSFTLPNGSSWADGGWHLLDVSVSGPSAPQQVGAVAGVNSAVVSWQASSATVSAGDTAVAGYVVTAVGAGQRLVKSVPPTATSVTVSGLTAGTAYALSVAAFNVHGTGPGASATATPTGADNTYPAAVLADAPAAYYRLGDTGQLATDSSGHGLTGVFSGTPASGATGALVGDGYSALRGAGFSVNSASGLPVGSAARTFEVWMKGGEGDRAVFVEGDFQVTTGSTGAWLKVNGLSFTLPNGSSWADGGWHLLDVSVSGTTVTLFFDGRSLGQQSLSSVLATGGGRWWLAQGVGCCTYGYNGSLDEAALYPAALSAERVAAHYAASGIVGSSAPVSAGDTAVAGYVVTAVGAGQRLVKSVPPTATSVTVSGLTAGTAYALSVAAFNVHGTGPGASATATPTGADNTYPAAVLADAPAAYYRLGDTGQLATDSSGHGLTGLIFGGGTRRQGMGGAVPNDPDKAFSGLGFSVNSVN